MLLFCYLISAICGRFANFAYCADFPLKCLVGGSADATELTILSGGKLG